MIDLYLIRHAESVYNVRADLVTGRSPQVPLSPHGEKQAEALAQELKEISFDLVYSSPAVRALNTAKRALKDCQLNYPIQRTEALYEISRGDWEGLPLDTVMTDEVWAELKADKKHWCAPGGESQLDAERRMHNFVEDEILPRGKGTYALFSHAGAIRCFLRPILRMSHDKLFDIEISNASITHLVYQKSWKIEELNKVVDI